MGYIFIYYMIYIITIRECKYKDRGMGKGKEGATCPLSLFIGFPQTSFRIL